MRSATSHRHPLPGDSKGAGQDHALVLAVIEGFVAGMRPTLVLWLPGIRLRRRVLGVVHSGGRTRWLPELSCRVRDGASTWVDASAARLNELLAAAAGDAGQRA